MNDVFKFLFTFPQRVTINPEFHGGSKGEISMPLFIPLGAKHISSRPKVLLGDQLRRLLSASSQSLSFRVPRPNVQRPNATSLVVKQRKVQLTIITCMTEPNFGKLTCKMME